MKYNLIGGGRLGKNLVLALNASTTKITLHGLCNQSLISSQNALSELGLDVHLAYSTVDQLPWADVIFLAIPDAQIPLMVKKLKRIPLKPKCFIVHCSGVLSSDVLLPLKEKGCLIASMHPLKAFKKGTPQALAFDQVDCVIEGDKPVTHWLIKTFSALGARTATLEPEKKATYHASAVMASNYLVTLADVAHQLMCQAGLRQEQAYSMVLSLMQSSLNNLMDSSEAKEALTGPISRGDDLTLRLHLKALNRQAHRDLYLAAGLATLPMADLSEEKKQLLKALFETNKALD